MDALTTLAGLTSVAMRNADLRDSQRNFFSHMTEILVTALDVHLDYNNGHGTRVAQTANRVGRAMNLDDGRLQNLHFASLLHDIGMLKIRQVRSQRRQGLPKARRTRLPNARADSPLGRRRSDRPLPSRAVRREPAIPKDSLERKSRSRLASSRYAMLRCDDQQLELQGCNAFRGGCRGGAQLHGDTIRSAGLRGVSRSRRPGRDFRPVGISAPPNCSPSRRLTSG